MKTMKRYIGLYYAVFVALFLITGFLYAFKTTALLQLPWINWGALALAVILVLSPWGSQKLLATSSNSAKLPVLQWIGNVLLVEVTLLLLYVGIGGFNHSVAAAAGSDTQHTFATLQHMLYQFGLYPWALMAVFAVSFGRQAYIKQQDAYLSDICLSLGDTHNDTITILMKTIARTATLAGIAISFVILSFVFASLATDIHELTKLMGFTAASMGAAFLMLFLALRRNTNAALTQVNKYRPALSILLTVMIWSIVLMIMSIIISYIGSGEDLTPAALLPIFQKGWLLHWELFSQMWWLMFIPISAIFIARFSYGYSLRAVIVVTLALPLMLTAVLANLNSSNYTPPLWLTETAAVIGFLLFAHTFYSKKNSSMTILSYLPAINNNKPRSEVIYQQRLKQMCGIMFYLFIPAGFFITTIFMSMIALPMTLVIVAVYLQLLRLLTQKTA